MLKETLVCEVRSVGFELVSMTELKPGYLAIFKPGAPADPQTVKARQRASIILRASRRH
jgi:hypothetical protein